MYFGNEFETETEADYLFGSKKRKKAAAQAAQVATDKLLASGQPLTSAERQTMLLSADGKLSSKDKKIIKQAQRQDAKTGRISIKQEGKTERTELRQTGAAVPMQTDNKLPVPLSPVSGEATALSSMMPVSGGGGAVSEVMESWAEPQQQMLQEGEQAKEQQEKETTGAVQSNTGKIIAVVVVVILAVILFIKFKKK